MKGFRAQRYACEQQTARFEEMLRAQAATPPVLPEAGAPGRTYRDQVSEMRALEQARDRSLACARQAAMQQGQLKASLGLSPAGTGAASDEVFERDSAALLELIRGAGEGASTWSYEAFARAIETLRARLAAYRQAHQTLIAHDPDAPARLITAAQALFRVAEAWASELRAGRDAARFKADLEAGLRRDASPSARVAVAESRRGFDAATDAQASAARARTDALSRMQSSLAGLQTTDIPRTGAR